MMEHADVVRNKLFNLRMAADEWARLDALAKHYGLSAAQVIRMLTKRDADALGIATTKPSTKATKAPKKRSKK